MSRRLAAACLILGLACAAPLYAADDQPSAAVASDDGARHATVLEELRGKPLVVNFWATWCTPCRAEMPALIDAYEEGKERGLVVLGVALDDDAAAVRSFAAAHGLDYPMLTGKAPGLALMRAFGNERTAVPFTVAIDRNGNVVEKKFGVLRQRDLERMLAAVLAPPKVASRQ